MLPCWNIAVFICLWRKTETYEIAMVDHRKCKQTNKQMMSRSPRQGREKSAGKKARGKKRGN